MTGGGTAALCSLLPWPDSNQPSVPRASPRGSNRSSTKLTAYRLFIHRPAPATQAATTALSVSVTHKKFFYNPCHQTARAIMSCVRHTCRKWSFVASSPVGKTTQTSFSTRSSIVSLSNAYPASGWVIFYVPNCQRTISFHRSRKAGSRTPFTR